MIDGDMFRMEVECAEAEIALRPHKRNNQILSINRLKPASAHRLHKGIMFTSVMSKIISCPEWCQGPLLKNNIIDEVI